jgi:hypothetical protein
MGQLGASTEAGNLSPVWHIMGKLIDGEVVAER